MRRSNRTPPKCLAGPPRHYSTLLAVLSRFGVPLYLIMTNGSAQQRLFSPSAAALPEARLWR